MTKNTVEDSPQYDKDPFWKETIAKYNASHTGRSIWQLVNTIIPYVLLWPLMAWTLQISFWLTVPLMIVAAGLLVRIFIVFHDCTHGSFFRLRWANNAVGFLTGVLTFTSFHQWRYQHAQHHRTAGDLDRRGLGDVWTMTVDEFLEASRGKRLAYRLTRNPLTLFVVGPIFMFLIQHRFHSTGVPRKIGRKVQLTNLGIAVMALGMSLFIGFKTYVLLQVIILTLTTSVGHWLFYVQHQFVGVYWERNDKWNNVEAALRGSSYFKLPLILQWFSGNIGFHHVHHLSSAIPNYYLHRCYYDHPLFSKVTTLGLGSSFKSLPLRLWDETNQRLIGYRELRRMCKQGLVSQY